VVNPPSVQPHRPRTTELGSARFVCTVSRTTALIDKASASAALTTIGTTCGEGVVREMRKLLTDKPPRRRSAEAVPGGVAGRSPLRRRDNSLVTPAPRRAKLAGLGASLGGSRPQLLSLDNNGPRGGQRGLDGFSRVRLPSPSNQRSSSSPSLRRPWRRPLGLGPIGGRVRDD